jgi:hypothetical protein
VIYPVTHRPGSRAFKMKIRKAIRVGARKPSILSMVLKLGIKNSKINHKDNNNINHKGLEGYHKEHNE